MKRSTILLWSFGFLFISAAFIAPTYASEDAAEGEDDGHVEDEPTESAKRAGTVAADKDKDLDAEDEMKKVEASPDAEVTVLFTHPNNNKELPAGQLTKFLVGFYNKGEKDFIVHYAETSFRYPMDFSFYIQNYTNARYERVVQPKQEATFDYGFIPSENFAGRPLGLVVLLRYSDSDGVVFENAVFNETVTIVEDDSGFNTETGFLYVVFACIIVLLLLLGQQFLSKMRRKHGMTKQHAKAVPIEIGTANKHEVDFEWIPKELLNSNKSPKHGGSSPGKSQSPRNRKTRRAGDD